MRYASKTNICSEGLEIASIINVALMKKQKCFN